MSLMLHVDMNLKKDWVGFQRASDAPQLMGETSVDIRDLHKASGAPSSLVNGSLFARYSAERAKFGKATLLWDTSTTSNVQAFIGYDNVSSFNTAAISGTFTGVLWAKVRTGVAGGNTFSLGLYSASATLEGSSASAALSSSTWTKFTVTATGGSATRHLRFTRTGGSTDLEIDITGAMIVAGSTAPDWFNAGAASLLDDITDYWGGGKWGLGFVKPYQNVAPVGKADLTLMNADKRFSPEYASGPLYGTLLPNLLVQIGDPDYGIWWTGWTDSWAPEPGTNRDKKAKLQATDTRRFLDKTKVFVPLVSGAGNTVPVSLIVNVMDEIDLPIIGSMAGTEIAGGYEDISTNGSSEHPPYYFDSNEEGDDALRLLGDILTAVQGKFLFNREGIYIPFSSSAIDASTASVNIDYGWIDADYVYGERIINTCDVTTVLKKISSGTVTLWELDENVVLAAGESESFRVNYRNLSNGTNGDRMIVGGANVTATGWTLSSGTVPTDVTVTLSEQAAQSCLVTLANVSGSSRTVTAGTITGNKIIALRTITKRYEDATSITDHGVHAEMIKSHWIANRTWAKRLGKWLVTRFKDPRGEMRWVKIDGDKQTANLFAAAVTASVRIKDDQTSHTDIYGVIGEFHTVSDGLTNHVGTLYLEPMYDQEIKEVSLP